MKESESGTDCRVVTVAVARFGLVNYSIVVEMMLVTVETLQDNRNREWLRAIQ